MCDFTNSTFLVTVFLSVLYSSLLSFCLFFFNDTATTEIYTLSLHDALPICRRSSVSKNVRNTRVTDQTTSAAIVRSEEHTSELQSRQYLVCRLLLEKKKKKKAKILDVMNYRKQDRSSLERRRRILECVYLNQ